MEGRTEARATISSVDPRTGALRYRDRDVVELIGHEPFEAVWGLLVDGHLHPALPPAEPFPFHPHTGDLRVDVQSAIAQLAPLWGYRSVIDISRERLREDLARATVLALSFVARTARGEDLPTVHQQEIDAAESVAGRFLVRWRGHASADEVTAVDSYLTAVAEHGLTPSTRTARLGAARGADAAACLSAAVAVSSGPLGGGASVRALRLIEAAEESGDPAHAVAEVVDHGSRLWGFGHSSGAPVDPRADALHAVCRRLGVARLAVAEEVERAAVTALAARRGGSAGHGANVMYWGAVLLDHAGVPARMFPAMFACGRTAGWSAHIIDQRTGPRPDRVA
jgi:citrate synthase